MAKFTYNNTKNINTGHISSKLNYNYHIYVFFENNINPHSKFH